MSSSKVVTLLKQRHTTIQLLVPLRHISRSANMPQTRDGNIAAFFQPVDGQKDRDEAENPMTKYESEPQESSDTKPEEKEKGKRPRSSPPPASKRRDTKRNPDIHFSSKDLPPNWLSTDSIKALESKPATLSVTVQKGDLFKGAPENALLIHACNTQGSWGAGIARAFRDRYPKAYVIYRNFCTKEHDPRTKPVPTGTALLIPPVDTGETHWIGCLFTSAKFGKAKAKPEEILRDTLPATQMMLELVKQAGTVGEVRMCKINGGLFAVPWEKTEAVLRGIELQDGWKSSVDMWEI